MKCLLAPLTAQSTLMKKPEETINIEFQICTPLNTHSLGALFVQYIPGRSSEFFLISFSTFSGLLCLLPFGRDGRMFNCNDSGRLSSSFDTWFCVQLVDSVLE
jgi:hypothetical protein